MDDIPFTVRCNQSPTHEVTCVKCFDAKFKDYDELSQLSQPTSNEWKNKFDEKEREEQVPNDQKGFLFKNYKPTFPVGKNIMF